MGPKYSIQLNIQKRKLLHGWDTIGETFLQPPEYVQLASGLVRTGQDSDSNHSSYTKRQNWNHPLSVDLGPLEQRSLHDPGGLGSVRTYTFPYTAKRWAVCTKSFSAF